MPDFTSPFPMTWMKPTPNTEYTISELVMEGFGTSMLVTVGGFAVMQNDQGNLDLVGVALAHFFVLSFMIWAGAACGGAHYNGAVTIAMMISRNIGIGKGFQYLFNQFIGSLLGAMNLGMILKSYKKDPLVFKNMLGYPHCNLEDFNIYACVFCEFFFTFVLVFMVYATAISFEPQDKNTNIRNRYARPQNNVWSLTVGGALGMAVLAIGPITGAALNPWRVIGPALITGELFQPTYWYGFVYYAICPLAGAAMGGLSYLVFSVDYEYTLEKDHVMITDGNEEHQPLNPEEIGAETDADRANREANDTANH